MNITEGFLHPAWRKIHLQVASPTCKVLHEPIALAWRQHVTRRINSSAQRNVGNIPLQDGIPVLLRPLDARILFKDIPARDVETPLFGGRQGPY